MMKRLPPFVVTRMGASQATAAEHPDPELLTAFAEGNISSRERTSVLTHLADCSRCREVLTVRSMPVVHPVSRKAIPWKWRIAALAATLCVVVAGTWKIIQPSPPPKLAQVRRPEYAAVPTQDEPALQPAAPVIAPPKAAKSKKRPDSLTLAENSAPTSKVEDHPTPASAVPDQLIVGGQSRARFQKQGVLPNQAFSSIAAAAPANALMQAPTPNRQILWSLEALPHDGTIRKSEDGGRTWKTVVVDDTTSIYSVSATGLSIWVGGASGKLFHSEDGGTTWNPVRLIYRGELVDDNVTEIDARPDSVKVKTAAGSTFVTTDGGAQWARQ